MSGLAALFRRDGHRADEGAVRLMLAAAPYRGPDGSSILGLGPISLGHARMAVTPEDDADRQPLVSKRTGCAIVADVRLDNREELISLVHGASSRSTDADLMLRLYEERGTDAFAALLGDFACIIWDPRRRALLLARDTSGQRSLFYRAESQTFMAASEIQQLLQDPTARVAPNEELIRDFLVPYHASMNEKDRAATFYEGVLAVPAGNVLLVTSESVQSRRFWEFKVGRELRYRRDADYVEHYFSLFLDVVGGRLRTAGPVGALLSGGLDSSSVVGASHELFRTGRIPNPGFVSFTATFDGHDCDERDLVRDIQSMHGFEARFIPYFEPGGLLELTPTGFQESPNMSARAPRDALFGTVARAGVRVLLTGDIADSSTAGAPVILDALLRSGRLTEFLRLIGRFRSSGEALRRLILLYSLAPLLPLPIHRLIDRAHLSRTLRGHEATMLPSWMQADLRRDVLARNAQVALQAAADRSYSSPARQTEFAMLYPPEIARHPAPWPIELWRPFADRRLHEFLLAIPPEQKFRPDASNWYAGSKTLTRESMRGLLPESVRARTSKATFGSVAEADITRQWPAYEASFGSSRQPEIARRGYIDQARFWRRLQSMRDGKSGADLIYLMNMVRLETWLQTFRLPRPQLVTVAPPIHWGNNSRMYAAANRLEAAAS